LEVGAKAPNIALKDQNGVERKLSDLLSKGPVALVFYRSADWWPFCKRQLVQLRDNLEELSEYKIQIVGVSYDSVDTLKRFSDSEKIPFPLLSDEGSKAIEAFDLIFENGLPHPGTVLIGQDGVIRKKIFKEGYRTRHTIEELKAAVQELPLPTDSWFDSPPS